GALGAIGSDANTAATFNGSSSRMIASTNLAQLPAGAAARTLEAWVRTASTARQTVASYGTTSTRQAFTLTVNESGANRLGYSTWNDDAGVSAPGISDGAWHHAALVYA